jgi:hypothetical protein
MRTARVRTSGEYLAEVFVIAPPSQGLEPPANPVRFSPAVEGIRVLAFDADLLGHWEVNGEVDFAEVFNLGFGPGFLTAEVV